MTVLIIPFFSATVPVCVNSSRYGGGGKRAGAVRVRSSASAGFWKRTGDSHFDRKSLPCVLAYVFHLGGGGGKATATRRLRASIQ